MSATDSVNWYSENWPPSADKWVKLCVWTPTSFRSSEAAPASGLHGHLLPSPALCLRTCNCNNDHSSEAEVGSNASFWFYFQKCVHKSQSSKSTSLDGAERNSLFSLFLSPSLLSLSLSPNSLFETCRSPLKIKTTNKIKTRCNSIHKVPDAGRSKWYLVLLNISTDKHTFDCAIC